MVEGGGPGTKTPGGHRLPAEGKGEARRVPAEMRESAVSGRPEGPMWESGDRAGFLGAPPGVVITAGTSQDQRADLAHRPIGLC